MKKRKKKGEQVQRTGQACPGNQKKKKKEKKKQEATPRKKEKKKEGATSRDQKKEKKRKKKEEKKKSKVLDEAHVQVHMDIFIIYLSNSPYSVFSPF